MTGQLNILNQVRQSAARKILFLPHAVRQMSKPHRMISPADVRSVIAKGEIIEDYPDDVREHSCLMLTFVPDRPIHVVRSPQNDYLAIITAYLPSGREWKDNYRKRRK